MDEYISLQEATKYCDYSQEYLSLRARQGKLKAKKFGRNWVTTKEWLNEYLENNGTYNNHNEIKAQKVYFPPENLPIERPMPKVRFAFVTVLVFVLVLAGCIFGRESFKNVYQDLDPIVIEISQSGDFAIKEILNDTKNSYIQIPFLVQKFNENFDSYFITLVNNLNEGFDISSGKLAKDISSYTYIVGGAGDIIVGNTVVILFETISDIPQSFITVSKDINNTIAVAIKNINMGEEEITEGLAAISVPQISLPVISLPEIKIGKWFSSQTKEIALGISTISEVFQESYFNANKLVEEKISQYYRTFTQGCKAVVEFFKKSKKTAEEKLIPEFGKEGMVLIPSSEKDEEIKEKIKTIFSDEVKVEMEDKISGIITPIFKKGEGQGYLYILVPINHE